MKTERERESVLFHSYKTMPEFLSIFFEEYLFTFLIVTNFLISFVYYIIFLLFLHFLIYT